MSTSPHLFHKMADLCPSLVHDAANRHFGNLHWLDVGVLAIYFVFIFAIGIYSTTKNRDSVHGFFLAGKSMNWFIVGASLFSSNIGSEHFVGLAGAGAASGIAVFMYEMISTFGILVLGWLFTPIYLKSGVFTMPEYLKKRYGGNRLQILLAVVSLLSYILTKISANLFAGAIFLKVALNQGIYVSVIIVVTASAFFSITGGLTAVMFTDFIETIVMLVGGAYLAVIAFIKIGGLSNLVSAFPLAIANRNFSTDLNMTMGECGKEPTKYFMHLTRPLNDPEYPFPAFLTIIVLACYYFSVEQVMVQRVLSAKNLSHAKGGVVLTEYLKLLTLGLMIFPGMISRVLYKDVVACEHPSICEACCGSTKGCSNLAYPLLVLGLMPDGARGLMLAVMMAALMSSQTSVFNSASTIFTMDIWRKYRPRASQVELLIIGKVFILFLLGISILWLPMIQLARGSELFTYINAILTNIAPPIMAVFFLGVLWRRTNEVGAFWGLTCGLLIGCTRIALEFASSAMAPDCNHPWTPDPTPSVIKHFHFLHFGFLFFLVCVVVVVVISLATPPPPQQQLENTVIEWNWREKWSCWRKETNGRKKGGKEEREKSRGDGDSKEEGEERIAMIERETEKETIVAKELENGFAESKLDFIGVKNGAAADRADESAADAAPRWKRFALLLCGVRSVESCSVETRQSVNSGPKMIEEKRVDRIVCNVNAVVLVVVVFCVWGYFW